MKPTDVQIIGSELAVKWSHGEETFIPLGFLRRACPCASCKGEMDIFGNIYKAPVGQPNPGADTIRSIGRVGGYGLQPVWSDGHSSGIFSFDYLLSVAREAAKES